MKQKVLSILALLLVAATGAWAQGYTVTLKEGTEEAANWNISPNPATEGQTVTITYTGTKRVQGVTAVKVAAVEPMEFVEFTSGTKKVKFANMNLGATSVADGTTSYGDYYAWGATEPFGTVSYTAYDAGTVTATKDGGYTVANAPENFADAVTAKMGEGYRMPTSEDFQTLYAACGGTGDHIAPSSISSGAAYAQGIYWVEGAETAVTVGSDEYKANGVLFVQDATHHIFFPATGYVAGTSLSDAGGVGKYWSSSLYTTDASKAHNLFLNSVYVGPVDKYIRYVGYPIRPVQVVAPTYPIALSEVTSENIGCVVTSDGNVYPAKTAVPAGKTAVGILGKVTETGHGLILALKNATEQEWNTINGWTSVTTYAGTTLKVLPDNAARGTNLTSYTTLGSTAVSNWAVAQKSDYEAIFINLGSTTGNRDGKTYDGKVNAYITTGVGGTALPEICWSATEYNNDDEDDEDAEIVYYGWNFSNLYWSNNTGGYRTSVRPVLGF